jgi:hypothetical protein
MCCDSGGCSSLCRCGDEKDSKIIIVGSGQRVESIDDSGTFGGVTLRCLGNGCCLD